jgi:quaternary ammonium compound-resistance protein SugE
MMASGLFLMLAQRDLPIGTAYAVWTGIGTVGTFALGILILKEPAAAARFACVGLIIAGIVGLKLLPAAPKGA